MAEISCFVDVNNSKLTFMMSLDSEVNWQSFTEGISKYLSDYDLSSAPRFSYEDEDGDRVYFESDLELKEALDYASNLDLFIIFVNATEKVQVDTQAIPQAIPQPFPRAIPQVAIPESVPQVPSQEPTLLERVGEMLRKEIPQLSELYENFIESEEAKEGIKFVEQLVNEVADKNVLNDLQTFVNDNLKSVKSEKKCKEKKVKRVKKVKKEPSPSNKALHHAICDYCSNKIVGIRYKCLFCADYDLCETCEEINCKNQFHDATHYFAKIIKPVHQQHRGPVPRPVHREGCPARFQRIPKLEEKVQSLENELSQIKALLLQNNNNNIPQEEEKQSEAIAQQESEPVEEQIQQEEQEAPQQEEEPVSQLSPAEEQCLNALKEMGFDVHASLVSENQCDLLQILEKLVL